MFPRFYNINHVRVYDVKAEVKMCGGQRALMRESSGESEQKTQSQTPLKCVNDMEDCDTPEKLIASK